MKKSIENFQVEKLENRKEFFFYFIPKVKPPIVKPPIVKPEP